MMTAALQAFLTKFCIYQMQKKYWYMVVERSPQKLENSWVLNLIM